MPPQLVYNFHEIFRILARIDTVQEEMDKTINKMKEDAGTALGGFTGQARLQYDNFIVAFEEEKGRLFKLLDDTQEQSRVHVQQMRAKEGRLAELFGRTAGEVGGP